MKSFLFVTSFFLFFPCAVKADTVKTSCNLRYNNMGIIHGNIPCQATFNQRRLNSVSFSLLNKSYKWNIQQPNITQDPRWNECIRHTATNGNQWQVCTVPSPSQLGI